MTIAFRSNDGIYATNDDGSNLRKLSSDTSNAYISLSNDGSRLLFCSTQTGSSDVYLVNVANGSNLTRITNCGGVQYVSWTGINSLVYANSTGVFSVNTDGSNNHSVYFPGSAIAAEVSETAGKIAYLTYSNGAGTVEVANLDGTGGLTRVVSNIQVSSISGGTPAINTDNFAGLCWSPDGTRLAYTSGTGNNTEMYVVNANGTNNTRITYNTTPEFWMDWSPDGAKIAYNTMTSSGNYDIALVNTDGSNQINIAQTTSNEYLPSWSPDSQRIAYRANSSIYTMAATSAGESTSVATNTQRGAIEWESLRCSVDSSLLHGTAFVQNTSGVNFDISTTLSIFGLAGGIGSDQLTGNSQNNQIWGGSGTGNDILAGNGGADIYWFGKNDGNDVITASTYNALSTIYFYDTTATACSFSRIGDDLLITAGGTGTLAVQGWYNPANASNIITHATFADGSSI